MSNKEIAKKVGVSEICARTMKIKYEATNTVIHQAPQVELLIHQLYLSSELGVNPRLYKASLAQLFNEKLHK